MKGFVYFFSPLLFGREEYDSIIWPNSFTFWIELRENSLESLVKMREPSEQSFSYNEVQVGGGWILDLRGREAGIACQ